MVMPLQGHQVLTFFRPQRIEGDWTQQELGEFYRVEAALVNSGIAVSTDRGVSDEGDPWFVFCRQDNDDVIVHFARIDGEYVIVSNLSDGVVRGRNFNVLVRDLLSNHPYVLPKLNERRQTVYLHPAAMLAALIVTGYIKSAELSSGSENDAQSGDKIFSSLFNGHNLAALSALLVATVWDALVADPLHKIVEFAWFDSANDGDHAQQTGFAHTATTEIASLDLQAQDVSHANASHDVLSTAATGQSTAENGDSATAAVQSHNEHAILGHPKDGELSAAFDSLGTDKEAGDSKAGSSSDPGQNGHPQVPGASALIVQAFDGQVPTASYSGSHGSSLPGVAFQTASEATNAISVVYDALHIDPQVYHPVALTATNLTDAVNSTFSQLTSSPSVSANTPTASSANLSQTTTNGLTSSVSAHPFDFNAQQEIESFISHTPDFKIETFGADILIVDTNLSHYSSNQFGLEQWVMHDGSTISIIGQAVHHSAVALAA